MSRVHPPRWVEALLRRVLPTEDREAVLADMEELFDARVRRDGRARATWWYMRHALRFALVVAGESRGRGRRAHARLDSWGGVMMNGTWMELRRGARRLLRAPVFTLVSVITVGVGIGAFGSLFGVVDNVLLKPPPYRDPGKLIWIWRNYTWLGLHRGWLRGPDVPNLRAHTEAFAAVTALRMDGRNLTDADGRDPRRVRVLLTSANLFDVLGTPPALGGGFEAGQDAPGAAPVAVLGYDLWRSRFGSDPRVVGRTIFLDGVAYTVQGVMGSDFHFVQHVSLGTPLAGDLYVPLQDDLTSRDLTSPSYGVMARVRTGASSDQVRAAVDEVAGAEDALWNHPGIKMWTIPLKEDLVTPVRPALVSLLAAAALLLLVLGANLATLLLGRATVRDRELAVLAALGAGRARLVGSVLAESLLIAGGGSILGLLLTVFGTGAVRAFAPADLPRRFEIGAGGSVVAVTLATAFAVVLVAGGVSAFRALGGATASRLREGTGRGGEGRSAHRTRSALVVAQVSVSLVLLVGAGLLGRGFLQVLHADPGFDGRTTLTLDIALDQGRYDAPGAVAAFDERFREGVGALPGVVSVGATDALPLSAEAGQHMANFPDAPANTGEREHDTPLVDFVRATPGYAGAVGLRVLSGRAFTAADRADAPRVALIDDELARRFFPGGNAVGRVIVNNGDTATVVGVVDQAHLYSVPTDDRPQIYAPLSQYPTTGLSYAVAVTGDPEPYVREIRRVLDTLDRGAPLSSVSTLDGLIGASLGKERLSLGLLLGFAGAALLLATLGIYGVVSNGVVRRTHEMGVRMALGADGGRVVSVVLGQGLRLTLFGTLLGLAGAFAASRWLGSAVAGVAPYDPVVYAGVALFLAAVTGLAAYVPARRATRIDPVEALRAE